MVPARSDISAEGLVMQSVEPCYEGRRQQRPSTEQCADLTAKQSQMFITETSNE